MPHGIEADDLRLRLCPLEIPFQPLDCLRRLDPKIAVVLEGIVVRAAGGCGRGGAAVGGCGPALSRCGRFPNDLGFCLSAERRLEGL